MVVNGYQTVWVNVVFRMGGTNWWHFGLVILTADSTFEMGFTWFPRRSTFLAALRQRLLAIAVASQ